MRLLATSPHTKASFETGEAAWAAPLQSFPQQQWRRRPAAMPCITVVAGGYRAVVAVPAVLDGWGNWTVDTLLHKQLPKRLPQADEDGLLEILCDRAGNRLPHSERLSTLGLHPGQVLHAVSRDAPFVPAAEDYGEPSGTRGWALHAVNLAIQQSDQILGGLEDLRDVASSAASNDGSSTARSERTYDALTGAIERRGAVVNRIDASFTAGLQVLDRPSPRSPRRVSDWALAPYSSLRGSADLPPYNEHRYGVDNHTERAPLVHLTPLFAGSFAEALGHSCVCVCSCRAPVRAARPWLPLAWHRTMQGTTWKHRWSRSGARLNS